MMWRYIEGCDRQQLFLPDCVDDYLTEDSPVRIVDVFVDELDLAALGFANAAATGRPGYNPAMLFSIYRYRNQVPSSRRLEREAGRNVELMWLTGKLAPNFKTLADFRRDHGRSHFKTRMLRNVGVKSGPTLEYSLMCGSSFRPSPTITSLRTTGRSVVTVAAVTCGSSCF